MTRDHKLDNGKGVLIFLVALGHFIESITSWETSTLRYVHTTIYSFHMPAFVFLAGITASTKINNRRIWILAIILIIFNFAYVLPKLIQTGKWPDTPLQPHWILWFLLSLIWWQIALPHLLKARFPILTSVAAALVVGALPINGNILSIFRTFVFLPFFVAGHIYGKRLLMSIHLNYFSRLIAISLIAIIGFALYALDISTRWFYGSFGYDYFNIGLLSGAARRAAAMVAASISILCFISVISPHASLLSKAGRSSLSIFLLHGFVVIFLTPHLSEFHMRYGATQSLCVALLLSTIVVALLSVNIWGRIIMSSANSIFYLFTSNHKE
jgi:fucose 4-O-acetylase-like acetyltransferase